MKCPFCESEDNSSLPGKSFHFPTIMNELEKLIVTEAIKKCRGNQSATARYLQIEFHALRHLVEKHNLKELAAELRKSLTF